MKLTPAAVTDILDTIRDAFDGEDAVQKNLALRAAYDQIERLRANVERMQKDIEWLRDDNEWLDRARGEQQ